jgi:hypothetical protein
MREKARSCTSMLAINLGIQVQQELENQKSQWKRLEREEKLLG